MKVPRRFAAFGYAMLGSLLIYGQALGQQYPSKPVHVVVPFTAGSATDILARTFGQKLSELWGQPVIIDNRPGAGGSIGAAFVAKAPADGYTLLVHSAAHAYNPSIYTNLPFDTEKDFVAVVPLAGQPNVLVVAPSAGVKSVAELVALARQKPGQLNYGSAGTGSGTHINAEKFKLAAGIDTLHVPYRGTPEALTDTINGRVDYFFAPVVAGLSMVRDGRLTALAVGSEKRSSVLPDVPTTEEAGYKGSAYNFWVGMFAPAGTPPALVERLNKEVAAALAAPEVKERLGALGADASPTTPAELDKIVTRELKENADLANKAGIKIQ